MTIKKLILAGFASLFLVGAISLGCFAEADTPTSGTTRVGTIGDFKLTVADFTDIDNRDTWASGIPGIVTGWAVDRDDNSNSGVSVMCFSTSTTVTFGTGSDNKKATVFILSR